MPRKILKIEIHDEDESLTDQLAEIEREINGGYTSGKGWEIIEQDCQHEFHAVKSSRWKKCKRCGLKVKDDSST